MRTALVLALLLFAPPALAGDAKDPEMTDPSGDAGTGALWGDIVAGWFNETGTDIVFTVKLAAFQAPPPNYVWGVVADVGNQTFGWYLLQQASGPGAQFYYAKWDRQQGPTENPHQGNGNVDAGNAAITMHLPKAYALNGTVATAVAKPTAFTGTLAADTVTGMVPIGQFVADDNAQGKDFPLARAPAASPELSPAQPNATGPPGNGSAPSAARTPGFEALLGVLALAAVAARRR